MAPGRLWAITPTATAPCTVTCGATASTAPSTTPLHRADLPKAGGGTNSGFLTALYEDALNRSPDSGGLAAFSQALNQGTSPRLVAAAIFSSTEHLQDLVGD